MNAIRRSALLTLTGLAIFLWALVLDTWKTGRVPLRWLALAGVVITAVGLVDLVRLAFRARIPDVASAGLLRLALVGMAAANVLAVAGFVALDARGYSPSWLQFVQLREGLPYGGAVITRAADGTLEYRVRHGVEVSIERTKYNLDVLPSEAHLHAAHDLLDETKDNAVRFSDYATAKASGFTISTSVLGDDEGAMTEHLVNPDYLLDGKVLDPTRPEALVFQSTPAGGKSLVGIMYMTKRGQRGPQVGGPLTRWHHHPETLFCMDDAGVPRARIVDGTCAAGLNKGPSSEMMHVWLVDNAYGAFAHVMGGSAIGAANGATDMEHMGHH
jgi:hypothetical protein